MKASSSHWGVNNNNKQTYNVFVVCCISCLRFCNGLMLFGNG